MKILITGTSGFVAGNLAAYIAQHPDIVVDGQRTSITHISCIDIVDPSQLISSHIDMKVKTGSLFSAQFVDSLGIDQYDIIFHLAALCSAGCQEDFEEGMKANFFSSYYLLEACRKAHKKPFFIYASSTGVFGGKVPDVVTDETSPTPQGSYGTQKAMCELLINDYNRKGYIDGRALRFPTIMVRPGKPNTAASSFCSGIVREPMNGRSSVCPVSADVALYYLSPDALIENILHAIKIKSEQLGFNRILTLPGITVPVSDIVAAVKKYAGQKAVDLIEFNEDKKINDIVKTWPGYFYAQRALALGFKKDENIDEIVKQYFEKYILT